MPADTDRSVFLPALPEASARNSGRSWQWQGCRSPRPAGRRATGPATGSRPPVRRGRSRSAGVVNGRLGQADEGRGEGSEWLEAGLRGPAPSGPGRGSSPGHQRAIAAQIRDEDFHRVDESAHGSRRLRDGKRPRSTTCGPRRHPAARRGPGRTCPRDWRQKRSCRSVQTAWKQSFQEIVCGGWPPACSTPRRGSGWGKEATICQRSALSSGHATCVSDLGNLLFELRGKLAVKLGDGLTVAARRGHGDSPPSAIHVSSRQSAPSTILDSGALMPDCDYRPQV